MSKRPIYMRTKYSSWLIAFCLPAVLALAVYGAGRSFSPQVLVDNSVLKGRTFQGKVEEVVAPVSGIKGYFIEEKDSPLVAISFIFDKVGSAYDANKKQGLAHLVASTLEYGAGSLSAEDLRDKVGVLGIKIGFSVDADSFGGGISAPKENLSVAVEILHNMLMYPRFETKYVDTTKAQILKVLATEKENPAQELKLAFEKMIYGTHPYGRNPLGTAETVATLKREDLLRFVREKMAQGNLYIGISGGLNRSEAQALIDDIFGKLPKQGQMEDISKPKIRWQQPVLQISRQGGQNIAAFAAQGTCRKCEDFYPLYIANYLFGGAGLNSKLNQQIREKEGLTYGAYSALVLKDKANLLTAGFSATPDKFGTAQASFKQLWEVSGKNGFDEKDLQFAKNYLTASYNLRFASTIGIAEMLAYMQKYDLGLDFLQKRNQYVEQVTLQQLNQAAAKYFTDAYLQAETGILEKGEN